MPLARSAANAGRALVCSAMLAGCGVIHVEPAKPNPHDSSRTAPPRGHRFYDGRPYGSESQFNPFVVLLNGGLDQLRTENANRRIFDLDYTLAAHGAWISMTKPDRVLRTYGYGTWVKRQLF